VNSISDSAMYSRDGNKLPCWLWVGTRCHRVVILAFCFIATRNKR